MVHGNALNSYHKAQVYDEMDPKKLILMLYEGAIKRIVLAREGIRNKDPKQRGENLGKAIAIIAELNACLDENIKTEEINFLRGLYAAMLTELPKVSVNEDIGILDRAEKYLTELKRIWVTSVMDTTNGTQQQVLNTPNQFTDNSLKNYTGKSQAYKSGSIAI
ncbi:MAG: flagellar export chaperone FliS [Proteobacteria bacterium]|nr:flagellar export chaperone FliS [Pseudomonadota bacterium]MBU1581168.1 flagellar export chaperone FliS [Pseudomonadota bacterium]MBU2628394.1 flagellar export chaperone FliS [Pseudomonadota bacterium]